MELRCLEGVSKVFFVIFMVFYEDGTLVYVAVGVFYGECLGWGGFVEFALEGGEFGAGARGVEGGGLEDE